MKDKIKTIVTFLIMLGPYIFATATKPDPSHRYIVKGKYV
jgi:hypothetical protein